MSASAAIAWLIPSPALAKPEPLRLKPSSPWNVAHQDDYCRLGRIFGEGEQAIALIFERYAPQDSFRMMLSGQLVRPNSSIAQAEVRFGAGQDATKMGFAKGDLSGAPLWIFSSARLVPISEALEKQVELADWDKRPDLPPISPEQEAAIREIEIGQPLSRPLILETGTLRRAFEAFRGCTDTLLAHWGLNAARHRDALNLPKPLTSPGSWITTNDYPTRMLMKGQPALVNFRLMIDETGKVESCHIQLSTHPDGFHKAVCDAMQKRAKFSPALDKDGRPMRSYYINVVRFQF